MILIVDNSEERRKNLVIRLRVKGFLACGIDYNDKDFYTKPFMTVYINPPRPKIDNLKNDDTISVIFTDRDKMELPTWTINIRSIKALENDIVALYNEKCPFQRNDNIDVIGYACLQNDKFALGGRLFKLSKMQIQMARFFLYQPRKRFKLYEACQYIHFRNNPEENLERLINNINKMLKAENRESLIINEGLEYYLNPDIASYVCKEYEDFEIKDENISPTFINIDIAYDY